MIFEFSEEKDELLQKLRGVSFSDAIAKIEDDDFIDEDAHFNQEKYPAQRIYFVELRGYVYAIPYIKNGDKIFLKTMYPSRKATKKLRGKK